MAATVLAAQLAAEAQTARRVYRIGILHSWPLQNMPAFAAFRERLRDLGYVEGQNCVFEYRFLTDRPDRLPSLAAELIRSRVDIIVAGDPATTAAAKGATSDIPIVAAVLALDPVAAGFVASLARPGGNVTGLSFFAPEMSGKRLALLKETLPGLSRVAVLWTPSATQHPALLRETDEAGRRLGIALLRVAVNGAEDIDRAFQSAAGGRVGAMTVLQAAEFSRIKGRIAELGLKHRVPTISGEDGFAELGGLIKYGPSVIENWRRAANYVDRILRGAKPGDLPVEQPTKFELVINLKTAKLLGLTIPPSLLLRADQVIE